MTPTPVKQVRVAHIVTWSDRREAHEQDVNARLEDLSGDTLIVGVAHSADLTSFEGDIERQFSTLITYVLPREDE